jgi:hypothetical protein
MKLYFNSLTLGGANFGIFLIFLLGAIAAGIGGSIGAKAGSTKYEY